MQQYLDQAVHEAAKAGLAGKLAEMLAGDGSLIDAKGIKARPPCIARAVAAAELLLNHGAGVFTSWLQGAGWLDLPMDAWLQFLSASRPRRLPVSIQRLCRNFPMWIANPDHPSPPTQRSVAMVSLRMCHWKA